MDPKDRKYDVFLGYRSKDSKEYTAQLAEWFSRRGLLVWFDQHITKIGDVLDKRIAKAIKDSG